MASTNVTAIPGERWAYRASRKDPLVEVEVVRKGTQRPVRVLVRFIGEESEGRQDWVTPARLKVLWSHVEAYQAREARWTGIDTHPDGDNTPEHHAMDAALRIGLSADVISLVYRYPGVSEISDVEQLASELDLDPEVLRSAPESFEEDGKLVVPWETTELIARRICERMPERIMHHVLDEEAEAKVQATHGYRLRNSRGQALSYIGADDAARWDAEAPYGRPCREVLRAWCSEAAERHDELSALRAEVARVDDLLARALRELHQAGATKQAKELEREFGVPLPEVHDARRY
jgi:hypothetical protein